VTASTSGWVRVTLSNRCPVCDKPERSLGLSVGSMTAFGVGWSAEHLAWSFPMLDPQTGKVIGIRLRTPGGSKFAVVRSRKPPSVALVADNHVADILSRMGGAT
jgi:hypothetical protein